LGHFQVLIFVSASASKLEVKEFLRKQPLASSLLNEEEVDVLFRFFIHILFYFIAGAGWSQSENNFKDGKVQVPAK
jgi:hypothetical protein